MSWKYMDDDQKFGCAGIVIVGGLVCLFCLTTKCTGCAPNYSSGQRIGTITKLSQKGLLVKSWEGEMLMGGLREKADGKGGSSSVANIFEFSTQDDGMAKTLEDAMNSGHAVTLTYKQWMICPWTIDSGYVITKVEVQK